jgi:hypothetical protein
MIVENRSKATILSTGKRLTAKASGFTPFSMSDTQYDSDWRSKFVFCRLNGQYGYLSEQPASALVETSDDRTCPTRQYFVHGRRTSKEEISYNTSMVSRAALRLSSVGGILLCPDGGDEMED